MGTKKVQVIINGDDLGISETVNREMLRWARDGILTSATTMTTGPAFLSAPGRELVAAGVTVGVHMDFSEFAPLTSGEALQPMLGDDGTFRPVLRSMRPTVSLLRALEDEVLAQIGRMGDIGVVPDHLDSHHHDHFNSWMTIVLRRVRLKTGIRRLRSPYTGPEIGGAKAQFVRRRSRDAQRLLGGFSTPNEFYSLEYVGEHGIDLLRDLKGPVELMTHPGGDSLGPVEEATAAAIRDADFVELVSYAAIEGP